MTTRSRKGPTFRYLPMHDLPGGYYEVYLRGRYAGRVARDNCGPARRWHTVNFLGAFSPEHYPSRHAAAAALMTRRQR